MSSGRCCDLLAAPVRCVAEEVAATLRPITPDSLFPKTAGALRGARGRRSGSGAGGGERGLFS